MPAKKEGFNRVLDGLKKRQLQHDFKLERAAETYEPIQNIGSGAFGIVCEAVETSSDDKVAIKKVAHASSTPTLARRTLREIRVLRYIDHPNIVTLRDIFRTQGPLGIDVFLVMDLMQNNLHHIIYGNEEPLDEYYIFQFLGQLLRGLQYLHVASIAHRNLKPSNLLVNQDGTLRIADFGMAKFTDNSSKKHDDEEHCYYMTQHVATLPYRAPELLFVLPEHSTAVEMWAVGCIFGEMVIRNELLPGRSVQGQIKILLAMLGHPPQHVIDEIRCDRTKKLIQDYERKVDAKWDDYMYCKARGNDQIVRGHCDTIDFVKQLFQYDATKRISIQEALAHPYIQRVIEPQGSQKKCPFRVKKDMMQVEDLSHQELIEIMKQDVRSAENTYNEMRSGDYNRWMAGDFQRDRREQIGRANYDPMYSSRNSSNQLANGFNRQHQFGQPVSGYEWRVSTYGALAHPYIRRVIEPQGSQKKCSKKMEKSKVVILAVGSFNPPTFGHLRMLEDAKNSLELSGKEVVEGILSPVSIMYGKSTLIGSNHRLAMTEAAVKSSDWLRADGWECSQPVWTTTLNVLKHHQQEVKIRLGPDVEVLLLVGGDVVETFDKYNADGSLVWNLEDVQEIVSIGLVVQPRPGSDPEETLKNLDFLGWTQNVYVIKNVIASNVISSTSLRAAIKEHRSIKYTTPDEVITYIKEHNLYE